MDLTRDNLILETECTRAYLYTNRDALADRESLKMEEGDAGPQKRQGPCEGGGTLSTKERTVMAGGGGGGRNKLLLHYNQLEGNERRVAQLPKNL